MGHPVGSELENTVRIIGAGLAGSEAAWQCARRGVDVELFEMRPVRSTPAHQTADFAELVCSNSLKSDSENTAPWLLKEEMRRAGSLLLEIARECAVPAGHALAVDRVTFAARVTEAISRESRITVRREEVTAVDENGGSHDHRDRAADVGCAGFGDCAAESNRLTVKILSRQGRPSARVRISIFMIRSARSSKRIRLTWRACIWRRAMTRDRRTTSTAR